MANQTFAERLAAAAAYRPERLVRAAVEGRSLANWTEQLEAAVLFADISGFTRLSEQLARLGKRGAEEMTVALNRTFEAAIGAVRGHAGEVLAFGGDALTALFVARTSSGLPAAVQRARACAAAIHAGVDGLGEISGARLRIAIGLGCGPLALLGLEGGEGEAELLAAGPALERASIARGAAAAGHTVEDSSALALARPPIYAAGSPPALPWSLPEEGARRALAVLEPFLFTVVRDRIRLGAAAPPGEHRRVTCLFANIRGLDPVGAPEPARRFLAATLAAVERAGGMVNKFESADKGLLLMALFGAQQGHENDEERACTLAMALLEQAAQARKEFFGVGVRAGLNAGAVFAGDVGASSRKEFTVIGDTVNLAARLMSNAPWGKVLIGGKPSPRVQSRYRLARLPDLPVKGRSEPSAVHELLGEAQRGAWRSARSQGIFVGRERELQLAGELLGGAAAGTGSALWVLGEAGIGKSRLAREVMAHAAAQGVEVALGECAFDGAQIPYLPFRGLVRALLGAPARGELPGLAAKVEELVPGASPALAEQVAALLGLKAMEGQEAVAGVHAGAVKLVTAAAVRRPRLLLIEDLQWIDPLSLRLLAELTVASGSQPFAILGLARSGFSPPAASVLHARTLALSGLPEPQARALAIARLGAAGSSERVEVVVSRSAGNPFFVEELARALLEGVQRGGGQEVALPATIQAVVQARLDRLDALDRELLRTAAAIGRRARLELLAEVAPPGCEGERFAESVQHLVEEDLVERTGDDELEFPQGLLREVAYEGLSYVRRRQLHRDIGAALERRLGDNALLEAEVLAHHFGLGEDDRELLYADAAAARSHHLGTHSAAARHLRRVLALIPVEEESRRRRALGRLSEALSSLGEYDAAIETAEELGTLSIGDPGGEAQALELRARANSFRGELGSALVDAERAAELARRAGAPVLEARARHIVALTQWGRGEFLACDATLRGIVPVVRSIGDRGWLVQILNHLTWVAFTFAQPEAEDRLLEEVNVLSEGFGDRSERIRSTGMRAFVALRRGALETATQLGAEYRRGAEATDEAYLRAWTLLFQALLARAKGELALAADGFRTAAQAFRAIDDRYDEGISRAYLAEVDAERGKLPTALAEIEAGGRIAARTGDRLAVAVGHLARARVALACGAPAEAVVACDAALALATGSGLGQVELLAKLLRATAAGDPAGVRSARLEAERRRAAREVEEAYVLEAEAAVLAGNPGAAQRAGYAAQRQVRLPAFRARSLLASARALLAEGRPFEAAPLLDEASAALAAAGLQLESAVALIQAARARGQAAAEATMAATSAVHGLPEPFAAAMRARLGLRTTTSP